MFSQISFWHRCRLSFQKNKTAARTAGKAVFFCLFFRKKSRKMITLSPFFLDFSLAVG
jgi:hypothetical protein